MKSKPTDDELKRKLTKQQYHILREKGTEAPFSGQLLYEDSPGVYKCAACGAVLFKSDTKFDHGTGWPSFYDVATKGAVKLSDDNSHGLKRIEVTCANCGSHLGHLFNDAPDQPTGQSYCINSVALDFEPKK